MEFFGIEFGWGPNKKDLFINQNGGYNIFEESCIDIIDLLYDRIHEEYSECFIALKSIYTNAFHFKYLMARRFIKCNWSVSDETLDIDLEGMFHFEFVPCPMRGECKYEGIICNPKFNSNLSDRELEVVKLICKNLPDDEIAAKLFISYHTVVNHRRSILRKIGAKNKQGIYDYALKHKLI